MYIFILFLSAFGVLFECVFSLWVSFRSGFSKFFNQINYYIKAENKMIKHFYTKKKLSHLIFGRKVWASRSSPCEPSEQILSSFCYRISKNCHLKLKYYGLSLWASQKWVLLMFIASNIINFHESKLTS